MRDIITYLKVHCPEHGETRISLGSIDAYERKSDGYLWYTFPCQAESPHYASNDISSRLLNAYGIEIVQIDDEYMREFLPENHTMRDFIDYAIDMYVDLRNPQRNSLLELVQENLQSDSG